MITFCVSILLLVAGYLFYGRLVERVFAPDAERKTPAVAMADGVDYVPLPGWKIFMIQFLNIAGTGPIFGAIMGAKFGASAYLWIVFGCIFGGAMHDYLSGMLSLRNGGESLHEIHGRYLGDKVKFATLVFMQVLLILVGVVFVYTPAELLCKLTQIPMTVWIAVIFVYYICATMLPIDKIIGRIYPLFAFALIVMALGILGYLLVTWPAIPEITEGLGNRNPNADKLPIFPIMCISIACGAISGFHATQSPLMARCMTNERQGRRIFYGAMILEGIVALIWAAAATVYYKYNGYDTNASAGAIVNFCCETWLGRVGGVLAILGVVCAPITSGDTAFRSARLMLSDILHFKQDKKWQRIALSAPIFIVAVGILVFARNDQDGFAIIWRYFACSNQLLATVTLWALSAFLSKTKGYWHFMTTIPAIFMTIVVITYIVVAPECFGQIQYYDYALLAGALVAIVLQRLICKRK